MELDTGGGNKEGIESGKRRETKGMCGRETRRSKREEKMRGDFPAVPSDPSDVRDENLSPPHSSPLRNTDTTPD